MHRDELKRHVEIALEAAKEAILETKTVPSVGITFKGRRFAYVDLYYGDVEEKERKSQYFQRCAQDAEAVIVVDEFYGPTIGDTMVVAGLTRGGERVTIIQSFTNDENITFYDPVRFDSFSLTSSLLNGLWDNANN